MISSWNEFGEITQLDAPVSDDRAKVDRCVTKLVSVKWTDTRPLYANGSRVSQPAPNQTIGRTGARQWCHRAALQAPAKTIRNRALLIEFKQTE